MSYIRVRSGRIFDFNNIEENNPSILDIAKSLSNICRYTGHTDKHYSVAQHSVIVSHIVRPEIAMQGLMHDISEAYLGDVSSPLKQLLKDYKKIEKRVEKFLFGYFGLPYPMDKEVKEADLIALVTEQRDLMHGATYEIKPLDIKIKPVSAPTAYKIFLKRFEELGGDIQGNL